jgi:hypothetical protein
MASSFGSPQLVQARRSSSCMATLTHTHIVWRKLGPRLAEHFSLVATDLHGYGDSSKPPPEAFAEYLRCYDSAAPRYHHARDYRNAGTGKLPRGEYPSDSAVMVGPAARVQGRAEYKRSVRPSRDRQLKSVRRRVHSRSSAS